VAVRFVYTGIGVRDLDRSIEFYTKSLGMELIDRLPARRPGGGANLWSPGSAQLLEFNWYPRSKYRGGNELDHLAFECVDVRKDVDRLAKMGAKVTRPIEVRPKHIVGFVKEPVNGIWIELCEERT